MSFKYSAILGFMGQLTDRFSVYHEPRSLEEKVALASKIEGLAGLEPVYPFDFEGMSYDGYRQLLARYNLQVSSVNVNIKAEAKFQRGALTSIDPGIRAEAVRYIQQGMDWAAELGASCVTVCPLSDGHDYPFEIDYRQAWRWLVDGIGEAAAYRPEVRLAVEYKQSEPRAKVIVPNAGIVLLLCEQVGLDNVGITIDTGHALYALEAPAQSITLAADAGRLYLIHINDNYRNWDWDLMPGLVNYWDWLETIFALQQAGYDGWLVSDVFPARTDPVETLSASYRAIRYAEQFLETFGPERLRSLIQQREVIRLFDELQRHMMGKTSAEPAA
ncbi:MAG: sugar phosphate isomerase/epimerase [Caldilineae bacterium]|nr:MAG: sugar phosphate isomerase/epimerase [Caldilineae bacterium]